MNFQASGFIPQNCITDVLEHTSDKVILEVTDIESFAHYIEVYSDDLEKFNTGAPIEQAFPYLEPHQYELIMTGLTQEAWDNIMSDFAESSEFDNL